MLIPAIALVAALKTSPPKRFVAPPKIAAAARQRIDLSKKRRQIPLKPKPVLEWKTVVASVYLKPQGTAWGHYYTGKGDPWMMVAHKTLPKGTRLMLRYKGRTCEVEVGDRGPYIHGRTLDLAWGPMNALGFPYSVDEIEMAELP